MQQPSGEDIPQMLWPSPVLLVEQRAEDGTLHVSESALRLLREKVKNRKVRVCSVIGRARSGKSFLISRILGHTGPGGFGIDHRVNSFTKGIWVWASVVPDGSGDALLALDTEGLYSPEHSARADGATRRSVLALALSSLVIFNMTGTITKPDIEAILLFAQLAARIQPGQAEDLKVFLPQVVFLVRDFSLALEEKHGGDANAYLRDALQEQWDDELFPGVQCRTLVSPVEKPEQQLQLIGTAQEGAVLREGFSQELCRLVLDVRKDTGRKAVQSVQLDGIQFAAVVQQLLSVVNNPKVVVHIPDVFTAILEDTKQRALAQAALHYEQKMSLSEPVSQAKLNSMHAAALSGALRQGIAGCGLQGEQLALLASAIEKAIAIQWEGICNQNRAKATSHNEKLWETLVHDFAETTETNPRGVYENYNKRALNVQGMECTRAQERVLQAIVATKVARLTINEQLAAKRVAEEERARAVEEAAKFREELARSSSAHQKAESALEIVRLNLDRQTREANAAREKQEAEFQRRSKTGAASSRGCQPGPLGIQGTRA